MKKTFNKIRTNLAIIWATIISFPSKVLGQNFIRAMEQEQSFYWVERPKWIWIIDLNSQSSTSPTIIAIKITQILLIVIILVVWITNFIRIKKTDDKALKKKKIRNTIIIISILTLLLIAAFVIPARLLTR